MISIVLLLTAASVVLSAPAPEGELGYGYGGGHGNQGYAADYYAHPKYAYSYGVSDHHTGDVKTAEESRDGGHVKGSYSLVQPDGILRTVTYTADPHHGFVATVHNSAAVHKAPLVVVKPVAHGYAGHGGY